MVDIAGNTVRGPLAKAGDEPEDDALEVELLASAPSMFGQARVLLAENESGEEVRILEVGEGFQSATYVERWSEPVFAYFRAFDALLPAEVFAGEGDADGMGGDGAADMGGGATGGMAGSLGLRRSSGSECSPSLTPDAFCVLMLGAGGCAWPKHVLASCPHAQVVAVEVDPAIMQLAKRWFFVSEAKSQHGDRFRFVCADAVEFLGRCAEGGCEDEPWALPRRYHAIANDVFAGIEVPASLTSDAGLCAVKRCLVPGGRYGVNVVVDPESGYGELYTLVERLKCHFAHVETIDASDEEFGEWENYLVVASDAPLELPGAIPLPEAGGDEF